MASVNTSLKKILTAVYGREVRQSIHDAIQQCYDDATEGIAPIITTSDITGGTRVFVTIGSRVTSFDVMDGTATDSQVQEWLAAHPEAINALGENSVTEEYLDENLREKINLITYRKINLVDLENNENIQDGKQINLSTGALESNANRAVIFVPVENGVRYRVWGCTGYKSGAYGISIFDKDKNFLSFVGSYTNDFTIADENASYAGLSTDKAGTDNFKSITMTTQADYLVYHTSDTEGVSHDLMVSTGVSETFANALSEGLPYVIEDVIADKLDTGLENKVSPKNEVIFDDQGLVNWIDYENGEDGYYWGSSFGVKTANASLRLYPIIDLDMADDEEITLYVPFNSDNLYSASFYGEEKTKVGSIPTPAYGYRIRQFTLSNTGITNIIAVNNNNELLTTTCDDVTFSAKPLYLCIFNQIATSGSKAILTPFADVDTYVEHGVHRVYFNEKYKDGIIKQLFNSADQLKETIRSISLPLYGKNMCMLGDSRTQYFQDVAPDIAKEQWGINYFKSYAMAGATWQLQDDETEETSTSQGSAIGQYNLMMNAIADGSIEKPDIITIDMGTNMGELGTFWDEETDAPSLDIKTVSGAMNWVIQHLLSNFDVSTTRIMGVIPFQGQYREEQRNETWRSYMVRIREIYDYYAVPYYDASVDSLISNWSDTLGDNVHENAKGKLAYLRGFYGRLSAV